jgi:serine/threonine protein kinase
LVDVGSNTNWTAIACASCESVFTLVPENDGGDSTAVPARIGHFELVERIGAGSFGTVWKARDRILDRTVAIKLPRGGKQNALEVEQFLREARAAAQLRHPYIVSIHEVGRDAGTIYIVGDFIDGTSMSGWISGRRPTYPEAASMCRKIALALRHAHDHGVVHRDLKPGNIVVDKQGEPHITDFGLAKREQGEVTITVEGQLIGTPEFMAPEQARGDGHHSDGRTDIYALGVILYKMLTGDLPFRGSSRRVIQQVLQNDPVPPRKLNHDVPMSLQTICLKCLEKDPRQRFQTAGELADELDRFLRGAMIWSRPASRCVRWLRRIRRNRALVVALAISAIIMISLSTAYRVWLSATGKLAETASQAMLEDIASSVRRVRADDIRRESRYQRFYDEHLQVMELLSKRDPVAARKRLQEIPTDLHTPRWQWIHARLEQPEAIECGKLPSGTPRLACFSPDGYLLYSGLEHEVALFHLASRQHVSVPSRGTPISYLTFSVDGKRFALCHHRSAEIWDRESQTRLTILSHRHPVVALAFSPHGDTIATATLRGDMHLWHSASFREIKTRNRYHHPDVQILAFAPERRVLLSAGGTRVERWNVAYRTAFMVPLKIGHTTAIQAIAISPNGQYVVSASQDRLVISADWDQVPVGAPHHTLNISVTRIAMSPHSETFATAGRTGDMRLWDPRTGDEVGTMHPFEQPIVSLAYSADASVIHAVCQDGSLRRVTLTPSRGQPRTHLD